MDKSVLKSFATEAREELINKVKLKANQYGITDEEIKTSKIVSSDSIVINGKALSSVEKKQRQKLIDRISTINEQGEDGYEHVMEEVAYTWFNRFIALRFMEVNDYLPTKIRVLTSTDPDSSEPDLLREANTVNLDVDKQVIYEYKINSDRDGLFKYMIISQCDALNVTLPFMFEKTDHYTQLLFPDGLLNKDAFISRLTDVELIKEEWWTNVEIIGWLYQYYIASEKDRVIKAKKKYKKDEIPFATQLFTPDWIVRYMVQNTLGRYWIESHSEDEELKANWEFYLENLNKEDEFEEKLAPYINKELNVEDIKCFDPACGSGHILVYMFDVLYEIYERCGYVRKEIPKLIIEKNLYGLDIDDRAYQLACFAVVMKGMSYHNRLLRDIERQVERTGEGIKLNIASIQETNEFNEDDIIYLADESSGERYESTKKFVETFKNAKTYGSLIKIDAFDYRYYWERLFYIKNNPARNTFEQESKNKFESSNKLQKLINQAEIMSKSFDILVTNPPYMGSKYMNPLLTNFIKKEYESVKADLFSAFMQYCRSKVINTGHLGFLTPFVWMFISSYYELRKYIIENQNISSLIQLEYNAFPEACVPVCCFTIRNYKIKLPGEYIKLSDFTGSENQPIKTLEAIKCPNVNYRFTTCCDEFSVIEGFPIAYWISDNVKSIFVNNTKLGTIASPRKGNSTSDNKRFLRLWFEVDIEKINFNKKEIIKEETMINRWFPYNKGGGYRKWFGNNEYVIDWKNDAEEIRNIPTAVIANYEYFMKPGLTWSTVTSTNFSMRIFEEGFIFDNGGCCLFTNNNERLFYLALLNSKVFNYILGEINPTLNFQSGEVAKFPVIKPDNDETISKINMLSSENKSIAKRDWDSSELSWDYRVNNLVKYRRESNKISKCYELWKEECSKNVQTLKTNEEELNKIFINQYNLVNELSSSICDKDITLFANGYYRYKKKTKKKNTDNIYFEKNENEAFSLEEMKGFFKIDTIKEFISYSVGCMLGRYSLDKEGLAYAGGNFDISIYKTFKPDEDNILILSNEYFKNDIVERFTNFVEVIFGADTLDENITFIAETLGMKNNEMPEDTIRRYFLTDFYKDHVQTYKKRPIYWMFTSGKQKAFNCLIYMHRYDKSLLARIRTEYVHVVQDRMDSQRESQLEIINGDYPQKEKNDAKKELNVLEKKIDEIKRFEEKLHHMADKPFDIDLDDGVLHNYDLFKGLLAKI
ncbi:BREX-1 system adenine-specific DNA-methyltransferase PglX [Clostridium bornimense]|nr:BREX-1 system adenine-specific DNA-methyltransferase PglX [Clostridium bornimense]